MQARYDRRNDQSRRPVPTPRVQSSTGQQQQHGVQQARGSQQQLPGLSQQSGTSAQTPIYRAAVQQQPPIEAGYEQRRQILLCWNCDEHGHRFTDCPKPQAVLFCYRCGRKGYSLRNCTTCANDQGNAQARNQL